MVESASGVEVSADHILLTCLVPRPPACTVDFRLVESQCGGCLCSHPAVVWTLWIQDLSKEGTWNRWMDRIQCWSALQVEWQDFRTIKRLPPGERWNGSLLDEAHGSEFALEDDGGVGIRALVLQPHEAVLLPPLVLEFRQLRRAPLRRADVEQFGYTDNCLGCANATASRKQAVDHP